MKIFPFSVNHGGAFQSSIYVTTCQKNSGYITARYAKVLNLQGYTGYTNFRKFDRSEYASGCNYGRALNIPGFRIYQVSVYANVTQGFECT